MTDTYNYFDGDIFSIDEIRAVSVNVVRSGPAPVFTMPPDSTGSSIGRMPKEYQGEIITDPMDIFEIGEIIDSLSLMRVVNGILKFKTLQKIKILSRSPDGVYYYLASRCSSELDFPLPADPNVSVITDS